MKINIMYIGTGIVKIEIDGEVMEISLPSNTLAQLSTGEYDIDCEKSLSKFRTEMGVKKALINTTYVKEKNGDKDMFGNTHKGIVKKRWAW